MGISSNATFTAPAGATGYGDTFGGMPRKRENVTLIVNTTNGSVDYTETHQQGAVTTITAKPDLGYVFTSWIGDASAANNPLNLTMDSNKTIEAIFSQDTLDPDNDGLTNYQELAIFGTDPQTPNPNVQYLKYTIENDAVTITDCDTAASLELIITSIIEGKPFTSIVEISF